MEQTQNPKCSRCKCYWKPDEGDIKSSGLHFKTCKKCRECHKQYRLENADKIKEQNKQYYLENVDKIKEHHKQYNLENADKVKEINKQYRLENVDKINEYYRIYLSNIKENNPMRYLAIIQRQQLSKCLKYINEGKKGHSVEYLGCSYDEFHKHIETKMNNWNNDNPDNLMDFTNIHVDHIKPISRFNFTDEGNELLDCCHFTNLQPLLVIDNLSKNNKWTDENEVYWNENIRGNPEYNKVYY